MFTPRISRDDAVAEFNNIMLDDARVLKEYADIAALQWILQSRAALSPLHISDIFITIFYRVVSYIKSVFLRLPRPDNK